MAEVDPFVKALIESIGPNDLRPKDVLSFMDPSYITNQYPYAFPKNVPSGYDPTLIDRGVMYSYPKSKSEPKSKPKSAPIPKSLPAPIPTPTPVPTTKSLPVPTPVSVDAPKNTFTEYPVTEYRYPMTEHNYPMTEYRYPVAKYTSQLPVNVPNNTMPVPVDSNGVTKTSALKGNLLHGVSPALNTLAGLAALDEAINGKNPTALGMLIPNAAGIGLGSLLYSTPLNEGEDKLMAEINTLPFQGSIAAATNGTNMSTAKQYADSIASSLNFESPVQQQTIDSIISDDKAKTVEPTKNDAIIDKGISTLDYEGFNRGKGVYSTQEANKKSLDELAKEIMAGKHGNGTDRKQKLLSLGYTQEEIANAQKLVNKSMPKPAVKTNTKTSPRPAVKRNVDSVIARPTVVNTPVQPVNANFAPSGYAIGHEAYYDPISGQLRFR